MLHKNVAETGIYNHSEHISGTKFTVVLSVVVSIEQVEIHYIVFVVMRCNASVVQQKGVLYSCSNLAPNSKNNN